MTMFVVGRSPDIGVQRAVANEARTHGDIMMVDIHETYNNLPLKALGMASLGLGSGRRGMRSRSRSVRSCHACARLPSLNIHDLLFSYTFTSRPCAFSVRLWLSMTPSSISKSTTTCTSSRTAGRRRCSSGGPRALATLGAWVVRDLWCGGCVDGEGLCGWQRFEWVASGTAVIEMVWAGTVGAKECWPTLLLHPAKQRQVRQHWVQDNPEQRTRLVLPLGPHVAAQPLPPVHGRR